MKNYRLKNAYKPKEEVVSPAQEEEEQHPRVRIAITQLSIEIVNVKINSHEKNQPKRVSKLAAIHRGAHAYQSRKW